MNCDLSKSNIFARPQSTGGNRPSSSGGDSFIMHFILKRFKYWEEMKSHCQMWKEEFVVQNQLFEKNKWPVTIDQFPIKRWRWGKMLKLWTKPPVWGELTSNQLLFVLFKCVMKISASKQYPHQLRSERASKTANRIFNSAPTSLNLTFRAVNILCLILNF